MRNVYSQKENKKPWIISVDMGYGHQRAAYPLKDIAYQRIITANNDRIISDKDRGLWEKSRRFYEFVSRIKDYPLIGKILFGIYDRFQEISPFYPFRDLSKPNFSVLRLEKLIKKGLCKSLVEYISTEERKIVTTHFIPAMALDYAGKECYCIVTDTDAHRIWVPSNPKKSKIIYFAPCTHVVHRLQEYGVKPENIIETGFPLPKENIGTNTEFLRNDLMARLVNLDPRGIFFQKYGELVKKKLSLERGKQINLKSLTKYKTHNLTLTFMIGGAGAQKDIGIIIIHSLKKKIMNGIIQINIVVGTKLDLKMFFEQKISEIGLKEQLDKGIRIIFAIDKKTYFEKTNEALRKTDILWTKPSEMSFYTALGIPIIIAPPIGAHERQNMKWLENMGSGFVQEDPQYVDEWLFGWINDGRLADAAIQGFLDAPLTGTYNIEKLLSIDTKDASGAKFKNIR